MKDEVSVLKLHGAATGSASKFDSCYQVVVVSFFVVVLLLLSFFFFFPQQYRNSSNYFS